MYHKTQPHLVIQEDRREYQCVFAYIVDVDETKALMIGVPVVRDFPDVFPEELPREVSR